MHSLGSLNLIVKPNNLLKLVYHSVRCLLNLHTHQVIRARLHIKKKETVPAFSFMNLTTLPTLTIDSLPN